MSTEEGERKKRECHRILESKTEAKRKKRKKKKKKNKLPRL
jgi:hypothetical protein